MALVSRATMGNWPQRRFRTNVVLDDNSVTGAEDALVGAQVAIADAVLDVGMRIERCVMVTRPQPGEVARDPDVLRTIHRSRDGCLAVGATVASPGVLSVGDVVEVRGRQ